MGQILAHDPDSSSVNYCSILMNPSPLIESLQEISVRLALAAKASDLRHQLQIANQCCDNLSMRGFNTPSAPSVVSPNSKQLYVGVVSHAVGSGADIGIFGCTEVGLLIRQADFNIPV